MKFKNMFKMIIPAFVALSSCYSSAQAADEQLLKAMRDEIARSMKELKIENLKSPYYIEYRLKISNDKSVKSILGSLAESNSMKTAALTVQVRVGDYKFDNTNFFDIGLSFFGSGDDEERYKNRRIPVELNYTALRRELWLATDAAYKQAAELLSKKEAAVKNRIRKDTTNDFIKLDPERSFDEKAFPEFELAKYEKIANELSGLLKAYPEIYSSSVGIEFQPDTYYYVNSEGREYVKNTLYTGVEVVMATQATDGMPLSNYYTSITSSPSDLPSLDSLKNVVKQTADVLKYSKIAKELDESYSGPVLFTDNAAAEIFAQVFAPNLVAQRVPYTEGGFTDNDKSLAFQNKIGARVLPEFLSIEDKPSIESLNGVKTVANYIFDDQGVKAKDLTLVKDGYLKTLCSERIPTRRIKESNARNRGGSAMFSTLILSADKGKQETYDGLKKKLIKLIKDRDLPYGIIIKKLINTNVLYTSLYRLASDMDFSRGEGKIGVSEAYRVFPDGKEELIRGVELSGVTPQSFKDIIAAGAKGKTYNYLAQSVISSFMTGGSQFVPSTVSVPDLLFEDAELKINDKDFKKPPFIANPLSK